MATLSSDSALYHYELKGIVVYTKCIYIKNVIVINKRDILLKIIIPYLMWSKKIYIDWDVFKFELPQNDLANPPWKVYGVVFQDDPCEPFRIPVIYTHCFRCFALYPLSYLNIETHFCWRYEFFWCGSATGNLFFCILSLSNWQMKWAKPGMLDRVCPPAFPANASRTI